MKILHVSDIPVGAYGGKDHEDRLFDDLVRACDCSPIDYLVVCGNLTRTGTAAELVRARRLLTQLTERVVRAEHREDRVVLVPGRLDLADPARAARFRTVFGDGRNWPYGVVLLGVEVRDLKDLTVVAIPFLQGGSRDQLRRELSGHAANLLAAHPARYAYCAHTPTLLVTPESPLLDYAARECLLNGTQLNDVFLKHFRVDLHLYGSSPAFCTPAEPFVFPHVGLSTGPRQPGAAFPARFNWIDLPDRAGAGGLVVVAYERPDKNTPLQSDRVVPAGRAAPPAPARAPARAYRAAFVGQLAKRVREARTTPTLMEYLPGELIDTLGAEETVPGSPVTTVLFLDFNRNDAPSEFTAAPIRETPEFGRAAARLRQHVRTAQTTAADDPWGGPPVEVVVVVRDRAVGTIPDAEQQQAWVGQVFDHLAALRPLNIRWVYAVHPSDNQAAWRGRFGPPICPPGPNQVACDALLAEDAPHLPLSAPVVGRLSGWLPEVCEAVVDAARAEFGRWPGARRVGHAGVRDLLDAAVRGGGPGHLVVDFRTAIRRLRGGSPVYAALRRRCRDELPAVLDAVLDPAAPTRPLTVRAADLAPCDGHSARDVDGVVGLLRRHELLDGPEGGAYVVRSLVPFLDWDD